MDTMHNHTTPANHDYSAMMSLALDGLLSPEDTQNLDSHFHACPACQAEWSKWQQISHVLQVEPFAGPPPGFALRVDQTLQRAEQREERILGGLMVAGGTVTVLAVAVLGYLLTVALWVAISPAARTVAVEYLGFARQFVVLVFQNLAALRDAVAVLLPDPAVMLVLALMLLAAGMLWIRLVFYGNRTRASEQ